MRRRLRILILLLVLAFSLFGFATSPVWAMNWSDGFETGDFTNWDWNYQSSTGFGTSQLYVTTDWSSEGSYSMAWNTSLGVYTSYYGKNLTDERGIFDISVVYRIDLLYQEDNGFNNTRWVIALGDMNLGAPQGIINLGPLYDSGDSAWYFRSYVQTSPTTWSDVYSSSYYPTNDTTYVLRIQFDLETDPSNCWASTYVNETLIDYVTAGEISGWWIFDDTHYLAVGIGTSPTGVIGGHNFDVFMDDVQVTPGSFPYNYVASLVDYEGQSAEKWVFANWRFYEFNASYGHTNATSGDADDFLDTVWIGFNDGVNNMTAYYNVSSQEFHKDQGSDAFGLTNGSISTDGAYLRVIFGIMFLDKCIDTLNVSISLACNDTLGVWDNWEVVAADYFNLYVSGGFYEYSFTGNSGLYPEAGPLDLYAYNNSLAYGSIKYRNLQHIKIDHSLYINGIGWQTFDARYGLNYMIKDRGWINGGQIYLHAESVTVGTVVNINFTVQLYGPDGYIRNESIYMFHKAGNGGSGDPTETRYWIDIWFDTANQSQVVGLRANAYEWPIADSAPSWIRWLSTNWGIDETKVKDVTYFLPMYGDNSSDVFYANEVQMVEITSWLYVSAGANNQWISVRSGNAMGVQRSPYSNYMTAIETPPLDESRTPDVPTGGWFGVISNGFRWIANILSESIGPGLLSFLNVFIGAIDALFTAAGWENGFSQILNWINSFLTMLVDSVGYLIEALIGGFEFLGVIMAGLLGAFADIMGVWVDMASTFVDMLGTGLNTGYNIWNDFGLSQWVILAAVLYPIYLIFLWDDKGIDAVKGNISFMFNGAMWFFNLFITIAQFALNLIGRIIESIPVVE